MTRLRPGPIHAALAFLIAACTGARPGPDSGAAGEPLTQRAAMVLSYPHDEHEFGELPPDLAPVPGASAELHRHPDRLEGAIATRIAPGHVGKLLGVVINNPGACQRPTPATACGPHEEEFNAAADGGFYLGSGAVAGPDGSIRLTVAARVGDASNVLCGGAANPEFDACARGFALSDPYGAEVTLVVLDNGPAAEDPRLLEQQLSAASPCPSCPPFTAQIAIGFGQPVEAFPEPARSGKSEECHAPRDR